MSLKINVKEKENSPSFNVSVVHEYVEISMHNTVLNMNGTSIEMDFGVIKDWFNTTYELIAENSVGTKKHTFFVDSHGTHINFILISINYPNRFELKTIR